MRVVGIHGIGQTYKGAQILKNEWFPPLNDGIVAAGGTKLRDDEFGMVAYGPVFRPSKAKAGDPHVDPETLNEDEAEWLLEIWTEAARLSAEHRGANDPERDEDPTIQGPGGNYKRTPGFVQAALRILSKSRFGEHLGTDVLVFGLRQVREFLHSPSTKQKVLDAVDAVVTSQTSVIVAHSLGSVVAYEALCRTPPSWNVHTLITIGSPLGIANVVFPWLTPRPTDNPGQRPPNKIGIRPPVARWVNIADRGDIVALEKTLAPLFGGNVEDVVVYNGWKSHASARYLTAPEVGAAVAAALR
jgi:hypothetical protein